MLYKWEVRDKKGKQLQSERSLGLKATLRRHTGGLYWLEADQVPDHALSSLRVNMDKMGVVMLISKCAGAICHWWFYYIFKGCNCEVACQKAEVRLAFWGCTGHTKPWTWASHWRIEKTSVLFMLHWHSVCFLQSCFVIESGQKGNVCACPGHRKHENLRELCSCFSPDTLTLPSNFRHPSFFLCLCSLLTPIYLLTHQALLKKHVMLMFLYMPSATQRI